ncbi:superoxide dismutase [Flexithrix dorotheae]|uniref:superoxide dismutase n=1 Tax=Flexithrix dorotheae TaxID=70993 RepID=UPI000364016F|nr:superoxide dismutase [Flexithrix dorotheae]
MQTTELSNKLFELPELQYTTNSLEPFINQDTMDVHYGKHHRGYVEKFNNALAGKTIEVSPFVDILSNVSKYGDAVRNNGGGHYNHSLFWSIMSPDGGGKPRGNFANLINDTFGSFENFKNEFKEEAMSRFGSGWVWLVVNDDQLKIGSTPNQDNPVMDVAEFRGVPILGLDLWEHAYYLKYQNKRGDYVDAFWDVVNWPEVERRYEAAITEQVMI